MERAVSLEIPHWQDRCNSLGERECNQGRSIGERMPSNIRITSQTPIGFIGLGYLGSRIARRLAGAGFQLTVYDRDSQKAAAFSPLGVAVAPTLIELARGADVVLSCLSDGRAVDE